MPDAFGLLFQSQREDPKGAVGATAQVYLCLSTPIGCQGGDAKVFLTQPCFSVHELRREIDRLQKELEYLWLVGRRSFSDFEALKKSQLAQAAS